MDRYRLRPVRKCDDNRTPFDPVGCQYRNLWLVDDRDSEVSAERTVIGYREGPPGNVVGSELSGTRPIGKISDPTGDPSESYLFCAMEEGNYEALLVEGQADAKIYLLMDDQRIVRHRRIQVRELP